MEPSELIRIYAEAGKVVAVTDKGEYILRSRLYGIFISIFILVWLIQFFIGKNNVKKLNNSLYKAKK